MPKVAAYLFTIDLLRATFVTSGFIIGIFLALVSIAYLLIPTILATVRSFRTDLNQEPTLAWIELISLIFLTSGIALAVLAPDEIRALTRGIIFL
jgi:hypothetical protein